MGVCLPVGENHVRHELLGAAAGVGLGNAEVAIPLGVACVGEHVIDIVHAEGAKQEAPGTELGQSLHPAVVGGGLGRGPPLPEDFVEDSVDASAVQGGGRHAPRPYASMPSFSITRHEPLLRTSAEAWMRAKPSSSKPWVMTACAASVVRPRPQSGRAMLYPISAEPGRDTVRLTLPDTLPSWTMAHSKRVSPSTRMHLATNSSARWRV